MSTNDDGVTGKKILVGGSSLKKSSPEQDIKPTSNSAAQKAAKLRQQAKDLMKEAETAELALQLTKERSAKTLNAKLDEICLELKRSLTDYVVELEVDDAIEPKYEEALAEKLRERRYSFKTMIQLVERIHVLTSATPKIRLNRDGGIEGDFNIGGIRAESDAESIKELPNFADILIAAQDLVDDNANRLNTGETRGKEYKSVAPTLKARLKDLRRADTEEYERNLSRILNSGDAGSVEGNLVNGFAVETLGEQNVTIQIDGKDFTGSKFNMTRLMEDIIQVPMWVPSSILPFLVANPTEIDEEDVKKIRSEVLKESQFRIISSDSMRFAAVFRGTFVEKKRASSIATLSSGEVSKGGERSAVKDTESKESLSEVTFRDIQSRLVSSGLDSKIQLFLMEDPEWRPSDREDEPDPTILAVSTSVVPEQAAEGGATKKFIAVLSIISTIFATFAYAVSGYALNPKFFNAVVNNSDVSVVSSCLPVFIGVFALSALHEAAHYIAAEISDVKLGLPVPLPSLQIGTFGCITPLRSFPRSRTALFDVAMSGPLVTALASIVIMVTGLSMTIQSSPEALSNLATVPAALFKTSFLVGSITSFLAPKVMAIPLSQPIPVHPAFLVGFAGLVISVLNMLPIGRLDGGRASTALFGRRSAYFVSLASLSFLAIAALTQTSAISIFFGLLVTVFQRNAEIPLQDELTEINNIRAIIFLFAAVLTVLTLTPFPGGIAI
eukprot:CAMPEP_0194126092 /NCGR_PEP_ID=MMETSP0150-20130528/59808_1 /TAXON_ID=122233 /ORGANISM="Chaetoceros debilis, Strain MM31A-1" /LENGTH=726 /DNA_ID=CAMNT_0038819937 /DNA_START=241 /DNA_END=2421 /DNA_ORIENTATION=+